jgi:hypothetical protein
VEQATALYESIAGIDAVRQLVTDRTKEGLYLEFKMKKHDDSAELDTSDARQFSRALSGFANSDGGLLIWGVETDKHDCACALKPMSAVRDFEGRLKKSLLNAVQPFVDGVTMESIIEPDVAGSGYVKVLIPRSDKTPHRAMLAEREYFRRSTEGFYRLEHFDLEDAFGRRPHPVLLASFELRPRLGDDPHEEVWVALRNEGRGMARYIGMICVFESDVSVAAVSPGWSDNSRLNQGHPVVSYADNIGVIHPIGMMTNVGKLTIRRPQKGAPCKVSARWYCEGMMERAFEGEIPLEERAPGVAAS